MTLLPNRPEWQSRGECNGFDPNIFFVNANEKSKMRQAQSICNRCPVKKECRDYGVSTGQEGIWGGLLLTRVSGQFDD